MQQQSSRVNIGGTELVLQGNGEEERAASAEEDVAPQDPLDALVDTAAAQRERDTSSVKARGRGLEGRADGPLVQRAVLPVPMKQGPP